MNQNSPLRAALPMYDWPEVNEANDQLWSIIKNELISAGLRAPDGLTRNISYSALWNEPDCVFSQTCSRPFVDGVERHVYTLATPVYDAAGCEGILNASQIVCRADDTRESVKDFQKATVVCNTLDSQSGFYSMSAYLIEKQLPGPFFGNTKLSGSHRESVEMIADGSADIGAIDPVSWELAKRLEPQSVKYLRVIDETPQVPGLPFIISRQLIDEEKAQALTNSLIAVLKNLPDRLRSELLIVGAGSAKLDQYEYVRQIDNRAIAAGHEKFS